MSTKGTRGFRASGPLGPRVRVYALGSTCGLSGDLVWRIQVQVPQGRQPQSSPTHGGESEGPLLQSSASSG